MYFCRSFFYLFETVEEINGSGDVESTPKPIVPDEPLPPRIEPIQSSGNLYSNL